MLWFQDFGVASDAGFISLRVALKLIAGSSGRLDRRLGSKQRIEQDDSALLRNTKHPQLPNNTYPKYVSRYI